MDCTNQDVLGIRNDAGELELNNRRWRNGPSTMLGAQWRIWVAKQWAPRGPSNCWPLSKCVRDLIRKAPSNMKCDKAAGPAGIIAEMLKADREGELSWQDWERSWSQAHRSSHEADWMGTRPLHPGDGEQRRNAFYQALCLAECHWCHHRCLPAAGEVHRCWKTALLCFHRPWESIRSCNKEGPLIGHKKSRGRGMSCVCHWGHMYPNARSRVRVNG